MRVIADQISTKKIAAKITVMARCGYSARLASVGPVIIAT